jgi:TolB-like protein
MKRLIVLAVTIFLGGSVALAQPTTVPSAPVAKVLIVPFKQMGDPSSHAWVGAAIQENMISDVTANPVTQAIGMNQPLANMDSADAAKAASGAGASIVVFGSYQIAADQLRVTGQVMDVASGRALASLQVTGAVTDLFKIEDTLGSQLGAALPQPPSNLAQVTYGPSATTNANAAPPAPVDTANTAAQAYPAASQGQAYPDASQTYAYPQTTYAYPPTTYVYPPVTYYNAYPYYYPYPSFYFGFGSYYRGGWGRGYAWRGGGWRGGGGGWHGGGRR